MSLTLAHLALEEFLPHLAQRRASGTLNVLTQAFRKRIYLVDGAVAGIASGNPREMLGHVLLGWGLITEEQLTEAMELQEKLATPLGRILTRIGAIAAPDLEAALAAQAEEALLELFLEPVTQRVFLENVVPVDHPLSLRLPLPPLIHEGVRRRLRLEELLGVLGNLAVVPQPAEAPAPGDLTIRERRILAALDGQRDIAGVALASRMAPFHVAELAARGVSEGFLRLASQAPTTPSEDPAASLASATGALDAGDLRRAWSHLAALGEADTEGVYGHAAQQLRRRVTEALAARRIAGNLIPWVIPRRDDSSLPPLSPAEAFALSRINDRWSLREIQRLTPVEELHFWVIADTLHRLRLIELRHPRGGPAARAVPR